MSNFKIGQFFIPEGTELTNYSPVDIGYFPMSLPIADTTSAEDNTDFKNESFYASSGNFLADQTYYVHCKIKRKNNDTQKFSVKLVYNTERTEGKIVDTTDDTLTQYITAVEVLQGTGWTDVEFLFTPLAAYDTIVFELQRNRQDYIFPRRGSILMLEITAISRLNIKSSTRKIGVKANPGFLFSINGSAIRVGRSGVYEMSNDMVVMQNISTCCPDAIEEEELNTLLNETYLLYGNCLGRTIGNEITSYVGNVQPETIYDYWYNTNEKMWYKEENGIYIPFSSGLWDDFAEFNYEQTNIPSGKVLIVGDPLIDGNNIKLFKSDGEIHIQTGSNLYCSKIKERTEISKKTQGFIIDYMYKESEEV